MTNPLISILVCTHNRAHLLPETMASIFAQAYRPVEIVVVDDGSSDGTPQVMAEYGHRIRYHRLPMNRGISEARTVACGLAKGELIAFQDDDDLMPPERLTRLSAALARFPSAVYAVGDLAVVDRDGHPTGHRWLPAPTAGQDTEPRLIEDGYSAVLWPTLPVLPHTTLFRRLDGEQVGWFDPLFRYAAEDKDFFARLGEMGPIAYVPEIVSLVRRGHTSLTANSLRTEYWALHLYEKHMRRVRSDADRAPLYRRLQFRVGQSLDRIALHRVAGIDQPDYFPIDFPRHWLDLLGPMGRARYRWRVSIRHPLRRLVRGSQ